MKIDDNTSTKSLVELYNANCKKVGKNPVKKFADRKTAVSRTQALMEEVRQLDGGKDAYVKGSCPACNAAGKSQLRSEESIHRNTCDKCGTEYYPDTGRIFTLDEHGKRSEAITKSWSEPAVKEARSVRHGVKVDGKEYKSTAAAFKALGLPMNECIKFRMELKAKGSLKAYDKNWKVFEL